MHWFGSTYARRNKLKDKIHAINESCKQDIYQIQEKVKKRLKRIENATKYNLNLNCEKLKALIVQCNHRREKREVKIHVPNRFLLMLFL